MTTFLHPIMICLSSFPEGPERGQPDRLLVQNPLRHVHAQQEDLRQEAQVRAPHRQRPLRRLPRQPRTNGEKEL